MVDGRLIAGVLFPVDYAVSFKELENFHLVRSMLYCGGLGINVYMNFGVRNKFSSWLVGSKVLREMEYDFLAE